MSNREQGDGGPRLVVDLQAAQSPGYRERGVARYALDFAKAVAAHPAGMLEQVLVRDDLPPAGRTEELVAAGLLSTTPAWAGRPGIFHALSPFDLDVPVGRIWPRDAVAHGWKFVVTVYDLIPDLFPDIYLTDPGTRRRYRARRQLIRAADHVMTLSRTVAADVRDRLGVPASRVTVVGAACAGHFTPATDSEAARRQVQDLVPGIAGRTIVYNGAVEPRKNVERLMAAYARIPAAIRTGTQLVLVCRLTPPERNHLEQEARRLGTADQVVLTGEITDEALVALYRTAELAVFPSLAEGYGLPVAEAMACGAPVLASVDTAPAELVSPEATFDPNDETAIAAAIGRPLADPAVRARLCDWSARPFPSWSDVADQAVEVYCMVATRPGPSPRHRPRRPTIALVTPWPPAASGVAVYSHRLVEHLRRRVDVEVFADGDDVPDPAEPGVHPAWTFRTREAARGGFDAVITCLGNSQFHSAALAIIRHGDVDPTTLAHDVRLTELYRHGAARGAVPEGFAAALVSMYGPAVSGLVDDGWLPPDVADRNGILMTREITGRSRRLIVTSEFAAGLARLEAHPADRDRIVVCPLAYPECSTMVGPRDDRLIGSFGVVNEIKQPDRLIEALAVLRRSDAQVRLVLAGPVGDRDRETIMAAAAQHGVAEAVEVTGFLAPDRYREQLARVGLAVQLRSRTNGESSAAVHDCVAHGLPVVATAIGPARELPEFVAKVAADVSAGELASCLRALLDDPDRRARMAESGLAYARTHDFARAADRLLELTGVVPFSE